jgi:PEP-CTERM/exosortase A-associated glycosyltransferase
MQSSNGRASAAILNRCLRARKIDNNMRVLHILDHSIPLHSGYTFRTAAILREQRARGWETFHLTSPKQKHCTVMDETVDGLHFYRTPPANTYLSNVPLLREIELMGETTHRLEQVVKRVRPHLLHAHSPVLNAIPALRVARRVGLPVIYEVRAFWEDAAIDHGTSKEGGLRYRMTHAIETYALRRVDAVITICEGLRGDIVGRGISADKVTVVPNAVDVNNFPFGGSTDEALKRQLGLTDATVIGFIGSFYAYEGLDVLLAALPQVLASMPEVRLLLVGGGPQEATLKAQIASLGIADKVVFAGRVPHAEVKHYYAVVDLLAYPRRSIRLTELVTPLKPLEAMAQGKLCIASDVGGHRELIRDGETGLLFRAGDAASLAQKVLSTLADRSRWPAIQHAARRFVEAERTWPNSVARYAPVYARLTGEQF